jgi:2,3-bisphosphoglycerate-dependent phosphoglycerate mutase
MTRKNAYLRYAAIAILACVVLVIIVIIVFWPRCRGPTTSVLLVRHAEKAAQTYDPPLSAAGVTAVYASEFTRTHQTVAPLATFLSLDVDHFNHDDVSGLVNHVLSEHKGETVVIAGHSDTVPAIIAEMCEDPIAPIGENDYDNLFVLTVCPCRGTAVVNLKYGSPD